MATTGPKQATIVSEGTGDFAWTDLANAITSDDARATASGIAGTTKRQIFSGFALAIPAGATVTRIDVVLEGYGATGTITNVLCQVHQAGTLIGNNAVATDSFDSIVGPPDVLVTVSAGDPGASNVTDETFGAAVAALVAADWNASTLGVVTQHSSPGAETFSIDGCTLEATFTAGMSGRGSGMSAYTARLSRLLRTARH